MLFSKTVFQREGEVPNLLLSRDLFQHFCCDVYVQVEEARLSYIRENQPKLRASEYTNLTATLGDGKGDFDEVESIRYGRKVVFPATYVGIDRFIRRKRQDPMAFAIELGHPKFFMKFTCNLKWPEIIAECERTNTKPEGRPEICNRVFGMKNKEAMRYVKVIKLFGKVVGEVKVIEFQKQVFMQIYLRGTRSMYGPSKAEQGDRRTISRDC